MRGPCSLIIYYPSERSSNTHLSPAMLEFSEFIFDQGLMDIPLVGGNFTWFKNRDPLVWSRIDWFLLFPNWEAYDPFGCSIF
jgi:hypothetical protein